MKKFAVVLMVFLMAVLGIVPGLMAQDEEIAGVWQSIGYGLWFDVREDAVEVYQTTEVSCLPMVNVPGVDYRGQSVTLLNATLTGLGAFLGASDYELTLEDGLLNFEVGKVQPIQAARAESLPPVCNQTTPNTPQDTFETFWHIFNEHYAFFDLREVDWQAMYDTYQPMITAETSEEELFGIFQEMIAPLGDGHVSISTMLGSYSPVTIPAWYEGESEEDIVNYIPLAADYLIDEPQFTANNLIFYGHLSDSVGYIGIGLFEGFSQDGDDAAALTEVMATILDEFQGVEAIVIDVRFNLGGDDTNGLVIAGHFADESYRVFEKNVWYDGEFHPLLDIYLEPTTDTPFTGDVYVLTSRMTISAAETFTLAMSTLPNVTLVGEPTNGMLSDRWFAVLPNGWIASLSNEQYLSGEGVMYERIGVPPDVEVSLKAEDFAVGHDPMVEAVLDLVQ